MKNGRGKNMKTRSETMKTRTEEHPRRPSGNVRQQRPCPIVNYESKPSPHKIKQQNCIILHTYGENKNPTHPAAKKPPPQHPANFPHPDPLPIPITITRPHIPTPPPSQRSILNHPSTLITHDRALQNPSNSHQTNPSALK